ncbi:MAG: response regulator [Lachnospiraceae bacterium]|nr:response regulator [Lachnospiraceae bacterium]
MDIFIVDDEKIPLEDGKETIKKAAPYADVSTFNRAANALKEIENGQIPDVVFCDIEMPGMTGLEFAIKLKSISPKTRVIFVTGYEKYAVEAFKTKAQGYLLKPLTVEAVAEELSFIPEKIDYSYKDNTKKLTARCFGHFDIYWKGVPLIFSRRKSKELLAYLIYRDGAACTAGEIAVALWEEAGEAKAEKNRIRVLINDIKNTLKDIGMEDVLIREHRQVAINKELIDCDFFKMLQGDPSIVNSYEGKFMEEFEWANLTSYKF